MADRKGSGPELEPFVTNARGDAPSPTELDGLASGLGNVLDAPLPPVDLAVAFGGASATSTATLGLKAVLAVVGLGAAVAVGYVLLGNGDTPVPQVTPGSTETSGSQVGEELPDTPAPKEEPTIETVETVELEEAQTEGSIETPSREAAPERQRERRRVTRPSVEPEDVLIERARRALASRPAATLDAVRVHERHYPSGVLAEEREVLRIEALVRLERDGRAEQAIRLFGQRYPRSPHRERLEQLVSRQD